METIKQCVSSICVSMIFFGIIMLLVPEGSMQNSLKRLVSVAIICSVVVAFSGISIGSFDKIQEYDVSISEISQALNDNIIENSVNVTSQSVKSLLEDRFVALGLNDVKTAVLVDIADDKDIYIKEIRVYCSKSDVEKCQQIVSELGLTAFYYEREKYGF